MARHHYGSSGGEGVGHIIMLFMGWFFLTFLLLDCAALIAFRIPYLFIHRHLEERHKKSYLEFASRMSTWIAILIQYMALGWLSTIIVHQEESSLFHFTVGPVFLAIVATVTVLGGICVFIPMGILVFLFGGGPDLLLYWLRGAAYVGSVCVVGWILVVLLMEKLRTALRFLSGDA